MATLQTDAQWLTAEKPAVAVCVEDIRLRDRICVVLGAGGHAVLAHEASAESLLASCNGGSHASPGCVVVGAARPDRAATSTVRSIRARLGSVPGVLVCESARGTEIRRALELGVDGVVLSDELEGALAAVVAVVCAGQVSVPRGQRGEVRARALTTRERQVLALVIAGLTNAQIAAKLFLAESTVKSHLSSAFAKLGVSSRNEAASLILDPERGAALGIRTGASERVPLQA
jgi:two-component system response regulator DesR